MTKLRKGQAPAPLTRAEFHERFNVRFYDPAYAAEVEAIARLEAIAWDAHQDGRKTPLTRAAGRGYADPAYPISVQWLDTRKRLHAAQKRWHDPAAKSRVLIICGSARNDGTCPGEISKTWRLTEAACHVVQGLRAEADVLDLSLVTSEYGRNIHPCKGCVSSAIPLCHWPCSCYPNHALDQADDWMAEIYERWVAAHGVIILAPTYWYQSPSPLKLMIDRMVCADGGNPDPSSTRQEGRRGQAPRGAGLGLPEAHCRQDLWRRCAWRRRGHREHAAESVGLARLDGAHRRRRPRPPRPLCLLL